MTDIRIANTELEQSIYRAELNEKRSRWFVLMMAALPLAVGAIWLLYSSTQVEVWRSQVSAAHRHEAERGKREAELKQRAEDAEKLRAEAEEREKTVRAEAASAKKQIAETNEILGNVRGEVDSLVIVINDLRTAQWRANLLSNSGATEAKIMEARAKLGSGLTSIETQLDRAMPGIERRSRVYLHLASESQRDLGEEIKKELIAAGFDVPAVSVEVRRVNDNEVRYFRKTEDALIAKKIAEVVETVPGVGDVELDYSSDPDSAGVGDRYQVWLTRWAKLDR
tara:strand:- start:9891 stop:10736 length:846 start_codon:yes stop_codon:yes gene_type:complete